jgi:hypothetical protein
MARPASDPKFLRVQIYGRVRPDTALFLKKLGERNTGRAVDKAISLLLDYMPTLSSASSPRQNAGTR